MTKEELVKLKMSPEKYKRFLERKKQENSRYKKRRKENPIKHARDLKEWQKEWKRRNHHGSFYKMARYTKYRGCAGKVTPFELWRLAKKQKLRCALTGEKLTKKNISLDHKNPVSRGGDNEISNLQLVTLHANIAKNSMNNDEFYLFCETVVSRLRYSVSGAK